MGKDGKCGLSKKNASYSFSLLTNPQLIFCSAPRSQGKVGKTTLGDKREPPVLLAARCLHLTSRSSIPSCAQSHPMYPQQDSTWIARQRPWVTTTQVALEGPSQWPRPQSQMCPGPGATSPHPAILTLSSLTFLIHPGTPTAPAVPLTLPLTSCLWEHRLPSPLAFLI